MTNKEIASLFYELASLMELHGENEFKTKVYNNAYLLIKKLDEPLIEKSNTELFSIQGLSKTCIEKIAELRETHQIDALERFRKITPEGVQQLLKIKGIGPKKVIVFWKTMNWETPGEVLYACQENRLVDLKGFGPKTQADLMKSIEYFMESQNQCLFASIEQEVAATLKALRDLNPGILFEPSGDFCRKCPILNRIDIVSSSENFSIPDSLVVQEKGNYSLKNSTPLYISALPPEQWIHHWIKHIGGSDVFVKQFINSATQINAASEKDWFLENAFPFIPAECRDLEQFQSFSESNLINESSIKGVIHNHTKDSDGMYSVEQMALECIRLGYAYLVISDHSKSAFYANGLSMERIEQQWRIIDALNIKLAPFKIYKSIESDILANGELDYEDDFLARFDLVISSIHSNLKMEEEKAMQRLIRAIENPYTRILGHPTGRLLLSRKGYPVNHKKLIDACAANKVCIELNANPLRLDMDYTWIPYAQEKNVLISINPDAHNLKGIQDIRYGVIAARKGGLVTNNCLNTYSIAEFDSWLHSNITI